MGSQPSRLLLLNFSFNCTAPRPNHHNLYVPFFINGYLRISLCFHVAVRNSEVAKIGRAHTSSASLVYKLKHWPNCSVYYVCSLSCLKWSVIIFWIHDRHELILDFISTFLTYNEGKLNNFLKKYIRLLHFLKNNSFLVCSLKLPLFISIVFLISWNLS